MSFKHNIIATYKAQIISVVCSFLCTLLVARLLGKNGQGGLALYMNLIAIATLLLSVGLPASLSHFVASARLEPKYIFSLLLKIWLCAMSLVSILLLLFNSFHWFSVLFPTVFAQSAGYSVLLLVHFSFVFLSGFLSSLLQAEKQFHKAGKIGITYAVLLLLFYAILFFSHCLEAKHYFYWILGSMLVAQMIQFIFYGLALQEINKQYVQFQPSEWQLLKPLFQFASLSFIANGVQFFSYKMDIWVLNLYHHNQGMIGVYALAVQLAQMLWLLPMAVHSVLYVEVSSAQKMEVQIIATARACKWISYYALVGGGVGYALSIYLIPALFGSDFNNSSSLIGILLFGIIPIAIALPISAFFAGIGQVRINLRGSVLGLCISLVAMFLLIPTYNSQGAAWASVLSYCATALYYFFEFKKFKKKVLEIS